MNHKTLYTICNVIYSTLLNKTELFFYSLATKPEHFLSDEGMQGREALKAATDPPRWRRLFVHLCVKVFVFSWSGDSGEMSFLASGTNPRRPLTRITQKRFSYSTFFHNVCVCTRTLSYHWLNECLAHLQHIHCTCVGCRRGEVAGHR